MTGTLSIFDHLIVPMLILAALLEWRWYWPRCVRAIASGIPGARARVYRNIIFGEWLVAIYILALWIAQGRPWASLRLGAAAPLPLTIGIAFVALVIGLLWLQTRAIFKKPSRVELLRKKLAFASPLVPHTLGERRGFWLVAITAGVCEEIVFRGFLLWYIGFWAGPIVAVFISSAIFGFAHIYLGLRQVPRTGLTGLILALFVLVTNSLWPAIIIHAVVDFNSGELGFRALGEVPAGDFDPGVPAAT